MADEVLTEQEAIELVKNSQLLITDDLKKVDLTLYDANQNAVLKGKLSDKKTKLNIQKVPVGIYYLHVGEGTGMLKLRVSIQH